MEGDEVPAQWGWSTISEVCETIFGQSPPSSSYNQKGSGLPFFQGKAEFGARYPTVVKWCTKPTREAKAGDILMSVRAPVGPTNIAKEHCAIGRGLAAIRPLIDRGFVEYWFKRTEQDLAAQGTGTTFSAITKRVLNNHAIPVAPLFEQERIVEKIETLFAELDKGDEALREVQNLLARYRQSVLKAAVTGTLTADWRNANGPPRESGKDLLARILKTRRGTWQGRGKYMEPVEPDTDGLPELPIGWVWASMDQLLGHLTSGSRDWKQYYGEGTGTFIMAQNVRPMRFDLTERFLVNPPPGSPDAVRSQVRLDDLLITIVGANTGDVCRFPLDVDEHYVCQSVALMRLVEPDLSRFVELYLSGKGAGRDQLEKHIYGAGRPHLSFEQLRSIAVPLPPNDEREELMGIVNETLSNLDHVRSACNAEAKRSAGLRQSVLKAAFSGKLVPQDPSDEPADKLLERIRTARAEKPKAKRKKASA
ncbi:restriction endonuclease subunit S [Novosphingopyxis sp. YJ-S2-01]|uniref:restriction endonuclease subunit S n=1 Tax=Novosphingopyxis sp. YJ-S2-01 TaxID=2794021 RepID=UPI001E50472C|nr:restriction endonuclease subunit S [Novosphingopyxis sp. YJ-S2-01]